MDIMITIPSSTKWETYKKELDIVADGSNVMNFKVSSFPKKANINDKCYIIHKGYICGYMYISGFSEEGFTCGVTGKNYNGKFIQRTGKFYKLDHPIPQKGFQGFRYFNLEKYNNE
jgi:hypothetical protein